MCGISGFVGPADHELLQRMTNELYHRGPDDSGFYEDDFVSLGVRRLSIIDIAGGHQPMSNEDGTIWTAFNGEIFNYRQLQKDAEDHHHRLRTVSDTEVLLHLWEDYGEGMVEHLRGMFAFVIYDSNRRLLFLARDHFGKKPLYYATVGPSFYFGSELRALLVIPELKRNLNLSAVEHYLTFFYNPLEESLVEGVYRLPPGNTLKYDIASRRLTPSQYWDPVLAPKLDLDERAALTVLEDRLNEAVKLRLESEVPMGILLSGGVDSSVVTAIAARFVKNLQTFHVVFEGGRSEARFASIVAEQVGAEHHELSVGTDILADFPKVVTSIDEPVADPSVFPTYYICREARNRVTVCLTGLGGDELFRGYPWLSDRSSVDLWFGMPRTVRLAAYPVGLALGGAPAAVSTDLRKYEDLRYSMLDRRARCLARLEHFPRGMVREGLRGAQPDVTLGGLMNHIEDDSDARDYLTIKSILPGDYLHKDDRLSMANSLELRSPLLDRVFASLCLRLPGGVKARRGVSKYVFKKLAVRVLGLPHSAIYRRKAGFAVSLQGIHREMLPEVERLNTDLGFFNADRLAEIIASRPSHENSGRVFALLLFLSWAQKNEVHLAPRAG